MATQYGYDKGKFYKVELDTEGVIKSRTAVAIDEAVPQLIREYLAGRIRQTRIEPGLARGNQSVSRQSFADGVLRTAYSAYKDDPQRLRWLLSDDPNVVRLFATEIGVAEAREIWGDLVDKYTQNDRPPDHPVPAPADVVQEVPQQGVGPLPPGNGEGPAAPGPQTAGDGGETPATSQSTFQDPKSGGDPVLLASGQLYVQVADLEVAGRGLSFRLVRTYLSRAVYRGPLGFCWDHCYNLWLREMQEVQPDGTFRNVVYRSNGHVREDRYTQVLEAPPAEPPSLADTPDAVFEGPPGFFEQLVKIGGVYRLELVGGVLVTYNTDRQAERFEDLNGNVLRLEYDAERRLERVIDPVGKVFSFHYDPLNQLRRVRDETGKREVLYTLDDCGDLVAVDLQPDGEASVETDYEYSGPDYPADLQHNLVRVTNPLGHVVLETAYGADPETWTYNRVIWQRSEAGEYEYDYEPVVDTTESGIDPNVDPVNFPWTATLVVDRRGHQVEHWFNEQGNCVVRRELLPEMGPEPLTSVYRYNADGLLIQERHPDGNGVLREYGRELYADQHGGDVSGASPQDRLSFGLLKRRVEEPRTGLGETRRIVTEYTHTALRRLERARGPYYAGPTGSATPGQAIPQTTRDYDPRGNLLEIRFPDLETADGGLVPVPAHQFTYDTLGRLTDVRVGPSRTHYDYFPENLRSGFRKLEVADADGAALAATFEVDALGRVTRVTTWTGVVEETRYNGFDLPVELRRLDPGFPSIVSRMDYDRNRRLIRAEAPILDADGNPVPGSPLVTLCRYDGYGQLVEESSGPSADPARRTIRYQRGVDGLVERETGPRGFATRLIRDSLGRIRELVRAVGTPFETRVDYGYNRSGEVIRQTDSLGRETRLNRDAFGRVRVSRDRDGVELHYDHDAMGEVIRQRVMAPDPNTGVLVRWREAVFHRDAVGRVIRADEHRFEPGVPGADQVLTTRYDYDAFGRPKRVRSPGGTTREADYDNLRRLVRVSDETGETRWEYDDALRVSRSRLTAVGEDAAGAPLTHVVRSRTERNARGLPTLQVDPLGNETRIAYDSRGLEARREDAAGGILALERDLFGQITAQEERGGGAVSRTEYKYDGGGNRTELRDPLGNVTVWDYDPLDRLVASIGNSGTRRFEYDGEGRRVRITAEDGAVLRRSFSPGGRLLEERADLTGFTPLGSDPFYAPVARGACTYEYTPLGLIARAVNETAEVARRYDSLGRLIRESVNGLTVRSEYDADGRPSTLVYPEGRALSFHYTSNGNPSEVRQTAAGIDYLGDSAAPAARTLARFRSAGSRLTGADYGSARVRTYHDPALQAVGADWMNSGGSLLLRERRLYGPRGETLLEQVDDRGRTHLLDGLGRQVVAVDRKALPVPNVAGLAPPFAPAAPAATQADVQALMPPAGGTVEWQIGYQLDLNANRQQVSEVASPGAAPVVTSYAAGPENRYGSVGSATAGYDRSGELIAVGTRRFRFDAYQRISEASGAGGPTRLAYDALGRLHRIEAPSGVLELIRAGGEVIEWRSGGLPAGQRVVTPAGTCHVASGGADVVPVTDLGGSIISWIGSSGALSGFARFDPFGRELAFPAAWPAPFSYRGYLRDPNSHLYLLPARAYDPELGRFLQRDPLGFPDGPNPYAYVRHAPARWWDRLGLSAHEKDWGAAAAQAGDTTGVAAGSESLTTWEKIKRWVNSPPIQPGVGDRLGPPGLVTVMAAGGALAGGASVLAAVLTKVAPYAPAAAAVSTPFLVKNSDDAEGMAHVAEIASLRIGAPLPTRSKEVALQFYSVAPPSIQRTLSYGTSPVTISAVTRKGVTVFNVNNPRVYRAFLNAVEEGRIVLREGDYVGRAPIRLGTVPHPEWESPFLHAETQGELDLSEVLGLRGPGTSSSFPNPGCEFCVPWGEERGIVHLNPKVPTGPPTTDYSGLLRVGSAEALLLNLDLE